MKAISRTGEIGFGTITFEDGTQWARVDNTVMAFSDAAARTLAKEQPPVSVFEEAWWTLDSKDEWKARHAQRIYELVKEKPGITNGQLIEQLGLEHAHFCLIVKRELGLLGRLTRHRVTAKTPSGRRQLTWAYRVDPNARRREAAQYPRFVWQGGILRFNNKRWHHPKLLERQGWKVDVYEKEGVFEAKIRAGFYPLTEVG